MRLILCVLLLAPGLAVLLPRRAAADEGMWLFNHPPKELLKKKQSGQKIEAPRETAPAKVVSLMDALRRSVRAERDGELRKSERRAPARHRTAKKATRKSAG